MKRDRGRSNNKSEPERKKDALRERAEKALSGKGTPTPHQDIQQVVHELEVHQIELEMQNEALREAQEKTSQAERRYADLYEFAPVGHFTFDRNGLIKEVNLTGMSLLGHERSQLIGKPFAVFVAPAFVDTFYLHRQTLFKTAAKRTDELQVVRKDGSIFYASVTSVPVTDADGKVTECRSVVTDITERKQAEETLRRQADMLNLSYEAIFAFAFGGPIITWNRGAEQLYGHRSQEAVGRVSHELLKTVHPQSLDSIMACLTQYGTWTGELVHTAKDGRRVTVEARYQLIKDDSGRQIVLQTNRDITERKEAEAQLRQAHKMEAVGTLAGGIAHDFNNILAAIIGFTEMVVDDVSDNAHVQHKMQQVLKASRRGRDLVKQILAFSRKTEGEQKRISLSSLVTETHGLLRASLPSTTRTVLDFTTTEDFILADPAQMQQVIMNLATNAAHAMREDGGQLTIGISLVTFPQPGGSLLPDSDLEPGTYVKLTMKDTGSGMTEEVRHRIYEPFFTTKAPGKGTGMGLAVVYGIVKAHGGALTVQSEVGQGSTFEVFLPEAQRPEAKKEETATSSSRTGTERILFVDDEEMLVEMAQDMLESLGYHVTVAADGSEAWNLFLEDPSRFDLVITDQTMPDVTGLALAQKMLRLRKGMPIILSTGYSEIVSAEKAKEVGICAFLMKPMAKKELAETIRRVLDTKAQA